MEEGKGGRPNGYTILKTAVKDPPTKVCGSPDGCLTYRLRLGDVWDERPVRIANVCLPGSRAARWCQAGRPHTGHWA